MFDLTGKVALVTGASGGIGGAIARALHGQGASVVLSGTRAEALEALKAELGERAHVAVCNLGDAASLEALPKTAEQLAGAIDILVNNAGVTRDNLFIRMKDEEWDEVIAVDLTAAFKLSRAVLRGMMKKRWGRIIAVTSMVGTIGNPGQANYAAAKAGIVGMTKSLAAEVASRNITANCVAPGFIATADDRCPRRGAEDPMAPAHSRRPHGRGTRHCRRSRVSGQRRIVLRHRPDPPCQWRDGHDLIAGSKA